MGNGQRCCVFFWGSRNTFINSVIIILKVRGGVYSCIFRRFIFNYMSDVPQSHDGILWQKPLDGILSLKGCLGATGETPGLKGRATNTQAPGGCRWPVPVGQRPLVSPAVGSSVFTPRGFPTQWSNRTKLTQWSIFSPCRGTDLKPQVVTIY